MSKEYAKRLKEYSETHVDTYQKVINDYQNDIIDQFGGFDAMIQLCLTNPQFSDGAHKSQFNLFKNFMESKNINIETEFKNDDNHGYVHTDETTITVRNQKNLNGVILPDLEHFHRYSLGLMTYYSDNIYYTCLSTKNAKYIGDKILSTKVYPMSMIGIALAFMIFSEIYWNFVHGGYDTIYFSLSIPSQIICIFLSLSYIFSANICIISLIIQTFDFWYKMFTMIGWVISGYFINVGFSSNGIYHLTSLFTVICVYGLLFVLDATSIKNKYKNMVIVAVVLRTVYLSVYAYFYVDGTNSNWNPFKQYNFQHSQINFKSIFVSSQLNLSLFVLKPIFSQINRKIRRYIYTGTIFSRNDDRQFVQRSYVLYKRLYVHWIVDSNSHLIEMNTNAPGHASHVVSVTPTPVSND